MKLGHIVMLASGIIFEDHAIGVELTVLYVTA
jgi:hypothetical protein